MSIYDPSAFDSSYTILKKILNVETWLKNNPQLKVGKSGQSDSSSEALTAILKTYVSSPNELSLGDIILVDRVTEQGVVEYVELFQINAIDATTYYGAVIGTLERGPEGATGPQGPQGPQGPAGPQGEPGADGSSIAIKPDAASCVALGDGYIDASGHFQVLTSLSPRTFTDAGQIQGPQGPQGPAGPQGETGATGATGAAGAAATVAVGTVTTGAAGSQAAVENVGTSSAAVFNFTIPQGQPGTPGASGVTSFGGQTGAITLGDFLSMTNSEVEVNIDRGICNGGGSGTPALATIIANITLGSSSGIVRPSISPTTFEILTDLFYTKANIIVDGLTYHFSREDNSGAYPVYIYDTIVLDSTGTKPHIYILEFVNMTSEIAYFIFDVTVPIPSAADSGKVLSVNNSGNYALTTPATPSGVGYLTTAPSSANTDGDLKFVVLSSEPSTKYSGYLYIITGA